MMTCNDPFVNALKEKGYNLVAYPKTSISLLHVYEHTINHKLKRWFIESDARPLNGFLKTMFSENTQGAIGVSDGQGANIDLRKTNKIDTSIATQLMQQYFGDTAPNIDAAFENTANIVFNFQEITTTDADEIGLRNWLNKNQESLLSLHKTNIQSGNLFVAISLLKAQKVTMQVERRMQGAVSVDMNKLKESPIQGSFKLKTNTDTTDQLLFEGKDEDLVFGVKLVRLMFSSKGILTVDNRQDFQRVLGENLEMNYFTSLHESTFIDIVEN